MEQIVPHVLVIQPLKDQERTEPLLQALERAGLTMVRFGERLGPSADEKTDLPKDLHSAAAVLVLWTSVGLQSGWVPGEVDLAARAGKLVPVTLDGVSVIPSQFQRYATLDLSSWSDDADDPRFRELIRVLQSRLAGTPGTHSEVEAPATTASRPADAPPAVPRSRPASRTSGFDQLGRSALTALEYAEGLRRRLGLGEVHMEHLVEGLFQEGVGRRELLKAGVDHAQLTAIVVDVAHTTFPPNVRTYGLTAMPPLSQHAARAVDNALGARRKGRSITSAALWKGVLAVQGCSMTKALLERGVGRQTADERQGVPEETVVPPAPASAGTREHVRWVSDDPVALEGDRLGRRGVAEALDSQLRELVGKFPGQSFLVHVDGSWGAGKSTLLRFLNHLVTHPSRRGNDGDPSRSESEAAAPRSGDEAEASRSGDAAEPWLVVDYDAWRQSRVGPPWLTLLQAIRSAVRRDHHPWWRRAWFSVRERARLISPWQWTALTVTATITVLLVVLLLVSADQGISVTAWGDVAKLVGGLVPVVAAVWLIAGLAGRFLSLDSRRSARAFLESRSDPMEDLATHFQWVLRQSGRTVLLLVDDLDRCPETFVVELLDAVQKLMREPHPIRLRARGGVAGNAGADASLGADGNADAATALVVVVAADGRWIRQAYDNAFASLDKAVREPGATIGSLFLEKLFQLTLPVPQLPDQLRQQYFTRLLAENGTEDGAAPMRTPSTQAQALARQVAKAPRHLVLDVLAQASPADRLEVADKAIHRLVVEAGAAQETKHALEPFGPLLDPTPRAMKRFVMAYSVLRAVRTAEGSVVGVGPLALWTVVVTRWPLLAEFLQGDPTAVRYFSASPERVRSEVPPELRALFDDPPDDLRAVMNHDGGPLDADLIRECCGQLVRS